MGHLNVGARSDGMRSLDTLQALKVSSKKADARIKKPNAANSLQPKRNDTNSGQQELLFVSDKSGLSYDSEKHLLRYIAAIVRERLRHDRSLQPDKLAGKRHNQCIHLD